MAITSGHLDALLNTTYNPQALAALTFKSGTATGSTVGSVTATTGFAPYAGANSLTVTSVDDSNNTIVVTAAVSGGGYAYGGGASSVPYDFTVVGTSGADLLLAANGAAATSAVSVASVASSIESGNTGALNNELFTLATNGAMIGASVALPQTLTFSALTPATINVATALSESQAGQLTSPATVTDSAANVQGNLNALQTLAAAHQVGSIALTDAATPTLTITAAQDGADATVLQTITSSFNLALTGATAAAASGAAGLAHVTSVAVSDSAANVVPNLSSLEAIAAAGKLSGIALTDAGTPKISLTAAQATSDALALAKIGGSHSLGITFQSAGDILKLAALPTAITLTSFQPGDVIDLQSIPYNANDALSVSGSSVTLSHSGSALVGATLSGGPAISDLNFVIAPDGSGGTKLLAHYAASDQFDAVYYLAQNSDVAAAVAQGLITNASSHFLAYGQHEGRAPNAEFNEAYYLAHNADVAAAVSAGVLPSGFSHYTAYGAAEGRAGSVEMASFMSAFNEAAYDTANPDIAAAVRGGVLKSGLEHYILFGEAEGRVATDASGAVITPSSTTMVTNTGTIYFAGTGTSSFTGTAGNDVFVFDIAKDTNGSVTINGFDTAHDVIELSGYTAAQAASISSASALASETTGTGTVFTLANGTHVDIVGVHLTASDFTIA